MQEIAVVERLQPEVAELEVALGLERPAKAREIEPGELRIEELRIDAAGDELREVGPIARRHLRRGRLFAEHFQPNAVQEQPRRHIAVGGVLLDQRARRHDRRLAHFFHRHAVVEIAQRRFQDRFGRSRRQRLAGRLHQRAQRLRIERLARAVVHHVDAGVFLRRLVLFLQAQLRALLAVQHIRARHVVLARAHQRELDLVLDVLDVERAALRLAAHQRRDHRVGQRGHELADPRGGRSLSAVHREERLGHRHGNLGRLEADHRAVAADHLVIGERTAAGGRTVAERDAKGGSGWGVFLDDLHGALPAPLSVRSTAY